MDHELIRRAALDQSKRETAGVHRIDEYCVAQNRDGSHRAVIGPQLNRTGASGVVMCDGSIVAEWGDPHVPEMAFSVTKSVLSLVAGTAFDDGLLVLDEPVRCRVGRDEFTASPARDITWRHLLQQTSQWDGELWGKPAVVDAQSRPDGSDTMGRDPGTGWAYNDVRVNLLALALTVLLGRPLPDVLRERIADPIGMSDSWSWHGYHNSLIRTPGREIAVVSGGAHWGGGLWINAVDLALLGELYQRRGCWSGRQLISGEWIDLTWTPCPLNPAYGLLWWLNNERAVFPSAPTSGRCARGNLGRHLLWVDPARRLVVTSRWGDDVGCLLADVSAAVPPAPAVSR
jgi:CubicO group peptidase (beta-lactamase class C family)